MLTHVRTHTHTHARTHTRTRTHTHTHARARAHAHARAHTHTHTNAPCTRHPQEKLTKAFKPRYGLEAVSICVPWCAGPARDWAPAGPAPTPFRTAGPAATPLSPADAGKRGHSLHPPFQWWRRGNQRPFASPPCPLPARWDYAMMASAARRLVDPASRVAELTIEFPQPGGRRRGGAAELAFLRKHRRGAGSFLVGGRRGAGSRCRRRVGGAAAGPERLTNSHVPCSPPPPQKTHPDLAPRAPPCTPHAPAQPARAGSRVRPGPRRGADRQPSARDAAPRGPPPERGRRQRARAGPGGQPPPGDPQPAGQHCRRRRRRGARARAGGQLDAARARPARLRPARGRRRGGVRRARRRGRAGRARPLLERRRLGCVAAAGPGPAAQRGVAEDPGARGLDRHVPGGAAGSRRRHRAAAERGQVLRSTSTARRMATPNQTTTSTNPNQPLKHRSTSCRTWAPRSVRRRASRRSAWPAARCSPPRSRRWRPGWRRAPAWRPST
jgi:hypothetical protein